MSERVGGIDDFLSMRLETLIAEANEAGFGTGQVLAGLTRLVQRQWHAHDEDPDPAEDIDLEAARAARVEIPADAFDDVDTEKGVPRAG
jgi:hypothetical protein